MSEGYRSSFGRWDEQAWVRSGPRRTAPFAPGLLYFPPERCVLFARPDVREAPPDVRERVLVHALYLYLEFTVRLETGPVNEVCLRLRAPDFLPWLPAGMRSDALRIYTDEAGHAEMSHALMSAVRRETGVQPVPHEPRFLRELARLRGSGDLLVELFFVIVSETLITGTLTELPRDGRVQRAVREVAQDHAADEARHHAYFRQLFEYVWPRLPDADRRRVAPLLPEIALSFLAPDEPALAAVLAAEGFAAPERIAAEAVAAPGTRREIAQSLRPTVRMLRRARALDEEAFRSRALLT